MAFAFTAGLFVTVGLMSGGIKRVEPLRQPAAEGFRWMAIVGDSSVTGAAADPDMAATWGSIGEIAADILTKVRPPERPGAPVRIFHSREELAAGLSPHFNLEGRAAAALDRDDLSFGNLIGRRLGLPPSRIVIAGQDGAMITSLGLQFKRVLEAGGYRLPPLALVSYVANDLCDPEAFVQPVNEFAAEFRRNLREQLEQVLVMQPDRLGTRIVFLAPLDLANIFSSPLLAQQKVRLDRIEVKCSDIREPGQARNLLARPLQSILANECPSLLGAKFSSGERLARARSLQEAQIKVIEEEIGLFNQRSGQGLQIHYAPSVRNIEFRAGDLAGDCFHPSALGHVRIAETLLKNELRAPFPARPSHEKSDQSRD